MITSLSNKTVKEIAALSQKGKERQKKNVFVVEGVKMFLEAPEERICGIYVAQSAENEMLQVCREKLEIFLMNWCRMKCLQRCRTP